MKRRNRLPEPLRLYAENLYENYLFNMEATSFSKLASIYFNCLKKVQEVQKGYDTDNDLVIKIAKAAGRPADDLNTKIGATPVSLYWNDEAGGGASDGSGEDAAPGDTPGRGRRAGRRGGNRGRRAGRRGEMRQGVEHLLQQNAELMGSINTAPELLASTLGRTARAVVDVGLGIPAGAGQTGQQGGQTEQQSGGQQGGQTEQQQGGQQGGQAWWSGGLQQGVENWLQQNADLVGAVGTPPTLIAGAFGRLARAIADAARNASKGGDNTITKTQDNVVSPSTKAPLTKPPAQGGQQGGQTEQQPGGQQEGYRGEDAKSHEAARRRRVETFTRVASDFISDEVKFRQYADKYSALKYAVDSGDLGAVQKLDPNLAEGLKLLKNPGSIDLDNPAHASAVSSALLYYAYGDFYNRATDQQRLDHGAFVDELKNKVTAAFRDDTISREDFGTAFNQFLIEQSRRGVVYEAPKDAIGAFMSWVNDPEVSPWYKFALAIGAPLLLGGLLAAIVSDRPTAGIVMSLLGLAGVGYGFYGNRGQPSPTGANPPVQAGQPAWGPAGVEDFDIKNGLGPDATTQDRLNVNPEARAQVYGLAGGRQNFDNLVLSLKDQELRDHIAANLYDNTPVVGFVTGVLDEKKYSTEDKFKIVGFVIDNLLINSPIGNQWAARTYIIDPYLKLKGRVASGELDLSVAEDRAEFESQANNIISWLSYGLRSNGDLQGLTFGGLNEFLNRTQ